MVPDGVVPVNAANGYLLGETVTGTTPKFIILDRNPVDNFDILMDTDSHIVFAVNDGGFSWPYRPGSQANMYRPV